MNEELIFFCKNSKKKTFGGGPGGGGVGLVGVGGQGGYERRIKVFVGGGGEAIFEPKTLSMYSKKEKEKKVKKKIIFFDRVGI